MWLFTKSLFVYLLKIDLNIIVYRKKKKKKRVYNNGYRTVQAYDLWESLLTGGKQGKE